MDKDEAYMDARTEMEHSIGQFYQKAQDAGFNSDDVADDIIQIADEVSNGAIKLECF